jgi:hypothetical protein
MLYLMYGINLLGDPETRIWTDEPQVMVASFDGAVPRGPQTVVVEVTSGGAPIEGARVCLSNEIDVFVVGESDYQGCAHILIQPASEGTLDLTVTKQNFLPFMGEIEVTDDLPPGRPEKVIAEDAEGPAARVVWSPLGDPDILRYTIYRNTCSVPESLVSVNAPDTTYLDADVLEGTLYYYWVAGVDSGGNEGSISEPCSLLVGGTVSIPETPLGHVEVAVFPNPFKNSVYLSVNGRPARRPDVDVFDIEGRWVRSVELEESGGGDWRGRLDVEEKSGRWLPPGIYLVRFTIGEEVSTEKVILLR